MVKNARDTGTTIGGRYVLEQKLGEGAFGAVWAATNVKAFNRKVAVKFLHEQHLENEEVVRRFRLEGEATAALTHPNVVTLLEFELEAGIPYLVSEFVEGVSLRKVIESHAESGTLMPIEEALSIFRQVCAGVSAAHAKGIVHRDLKPENVMVMGNGHAAVVKVLDFGIARILGKDSSSSLGRTEMGKIIGSLQYMSPEQVLGDVASIDRRTDVFALTAVLYELLTLKTTFDGDSYNAVISAILTPERPRIDAIRPGLGQEIEGVIVRGLELHRDRRTTDVQTLLNEAEEALGPLIRPRRSTGMKLMVAPSLMPPPLVDPAQPDFHTPPDMHAPEEDLGSVVVPPPKMGVIFVGVFLVVAVLASVIGALLMRKQRDRVATQAPIAIVTRDARVIARWSAPALDSAQWVLIAAPAQPVRLGADSNTAQFGLHPSANVTFAGPAFRMQRHEVTWSAFEPWMEAQPPALRVSTPWWVPQDPEARAGLPVMNVPWATARQYCEAIGGSLPTEEQWEFAARTSALRVAPWTGTMPPADLNAFRGGNGHAMLAGSDEHDITAEGLRGMAGNGEEWTLSRYRMDDGTTPTWTELRRTIRGLPLRQTLQGDGYPPAFLFRNPGCIAETCSGDDRRAMEGVSFRCVTSAP